VGIVLGHIGQAVQFQTWVVSLQTQTPLA